MSHKLTVKRRLVVAFAQGATVAVLLLAWQSTGGNISSAISHPTNVWSALRTWLGTPVLRSYIWLTVKEAGIGLIVTMVIAVALASLLASVRFLAEVLAPLLALIAALPKLALAPAFLIIFGFGLQSKVYFIAASLWFIPFQSLYTSLTLVDEPLLRNIQMLGASRRERIWHVYVPSARVAVVTSLRVTAAFALIAAVISEFLASTGGLGYEIQQASSSSDASFVMTGLIIVAVLGFTIDRMLTLVQSRFTH
jgi:sulfonate transport system permease protein